MSSRSDIDPDARRMSGERFVDWVRRRLARVSARDPVRIDPAIAPTFHVAGVLAPLWEYGGDVRIAFTLRSPKLSAHQGQISFPGGRCEPGETTLDAALRETEEELGVARSLVSPLGALDDVWSLHGFVVTPHVGWLQERPSFVPSPDEVERVIETDLEALMSPGVHRVERRVHGGRTYPVHYFDANGDVIWGMTADILHRFFSLLRGEPLSGESLGAESLRQFLAWRQA